MATSDLVAPMKIVTTNIYPPIPIRSFDWVAHYDDPEGPCGYGATEAEAIRDLTENYERGGPTEAKPTRQTCKPDGSCCDYVCGN